MPLEKKRDSFKKSEYKLKVHMLTSTVYTVTEKKQAFFVDLP